MGVYNAIVLVALYAAIGVMVTGLVVRRTRIDAEGATVELGAAVLLWPIIAGIWFLWFILSSLGTLVQKVTR